jgi:hypothetical protein
MRERLGPSRKVALLLGEVVRAQRHAEMPHHPFAGAQERHRQGPRKVAQAHARGGGRGLVRNRHPQLATITSATKAGARAVCPAKLDPSSNQDFGAGAPQSVWRRGSRSDQRSGSWSGSMVW